MIDITKTYKTREGNEVRIYATDGCGDDPVHGAIKFYDGWYMAKWTATGKTNLNEYDDDDLIEVKSRIQREVWVNVHKNRCTVRKTKETADLLAVTGPHPRLAARVRELEGLAENYLSAAAQVGGCGDGNCVVLRPAGMHTNGGCRCTHDMDRARVLGVARLLGMAQHIAHAALLGDKQ